MRERERDCGVHVEGCVNVHALRHKLIYQTYTPFYFLAVDATMHHAMGLCLSFQSALNVMGNKVVIIIW